MVNEAVPFEHLSCEECQSRGQNFFCDLPNEALRLLSESKIPNRYKKGQVLFYEGQIPAGIYCVNSGIVKVETEGKEGTGHILRIVQKGGILGYRSLFAKEPYRASAQISEDAQICLIPKASIQQLLLLYPGLALKILARLSVELGISEHRFCRMSDSLVGERIAEALLFLKENFEKPNWTRREIAEWAGTTPETVMRTLADFEGDGIIKQSGRSIDIVNRQGLIKRANMDFGI